MNSKEQDYLDRIIEQAREEARVEAVMNFQEMAGIAAFRYNLTHDCCVLLEHPYRDLGTEMTFWDFIEPHDREILRKKMEACVPGETATCHIAMLDDNCMRTVELQAVFSRADVEETKVISGVLLETELLKFTA